MSIKLQSIYGNCQPKKSNIIVEVVYRHPSMNLADFNYIYLNKLLWNISKQQKSIFLLGDFNVYLLSIIKQRIFKFLCL